MSKRQYPAAHRAEVEWLDSTIPHAGWMKHADVVDPAYRRSQIRCLSVGLLIANDKHGVVLASAVHGREIAGVIIIPRGQVRKVRRLR